MNLPLRRYWRLLARYLRPSWPRVLLLGLLLGATIALQLAGPQIQRAFIDVALGGGDERALVAPRPPVHRRRRGHPGRRRGRRLPRRERRLGGDQRPAGRRGPALPAPRRLLPRRPHPGRADRADRRRRHRAGHLLLPPRRQRPGQRPPAGGRAGCSWRGRAGRWVSPPGASPLVVLLAMLRLYARARPIWEAEAQMRAVFYGTLVEHLAGAEDLRANGAVGYAERRFVGAAARLAAAAPAGRPRRAGGVDGGAQPLRRRRGGGLRPGLRPAAGRRDQRRHGLPDVPLRRPAQPPGRASCRPRSRGCSRPAPASSASRPCSPPARGSATGRRAPPRRGRWR